MAIKHADCHTLQYIIYPIFSPLTHPTNTSYFVCRGSGHWACWLEEKTMFQGDPPCPSLIYSPTMHPMYPLHSMHPMYPMHPLIATFLTIFPVISLIHSSGRLSSRSVSKWGREATATRLWSKVIKSPLLLLCQLSLSLPLIIPLCLTWPQSSDYCNLIMIPGGYVTSLSIVYHPFIYIASLVPF